MRKNKHADSAIGSYHSNKIYGKPLLSQICKKSQNYEGPERNPVIVIHGFLGSQLTNLDNNNKVWGSFKALDAITGYSNKELIGLALPMQREKPLSQIKDNVKATSLLDVFDIRVLGMHYKKDAYNNMLTILEEAGYPNYEKPLPEGKKFKSLFSFYYDWRRDLSESSILLEQFIKEKTQILKETYCTLYGEDDYEVKFDIVAHSMGGILTRYFARFGGKLLPDTGESLIPTWEGAQYLDRIIIVGTPNSGYLDTCYELINGLQIDKHAPAFPPAVIGTYHTYYQMLPTNNLCSIKYSDGSDVDVFDINTWKNLKWGLANPNQDKILAKLLPNIETSEERYEIAIDHLEKCLKRAKQLNDSMNVSHKIPKHLSFHLFCGNAVETSKSALVDRETGKLTITEYGAGDGKVLAASARLDHNNPENWELYYPTPIHWDSVVHIRAAHMGITESYGFANNLIYYLLGQPPKRVLKAKCEQNSDACYCKNVT